MQNDEGQLFAQDLQQELANSIKGLQIDKITSQYNHLLKNIHKTQLTRNQVLALTYMSVKLSQDFNQCICERVLDILESNYNIQRETILEEEVKCFNALNNHSWTDEDFIDTEGFIQNRAAVDKSLGGRSDGNYFVQL